MTKKIRIIFTAILTMLVLGLSGCGSVPSVSETPTSEPTEAVAPDPEPAPTMETAEVDHCLDCHTDKQRLISTAKVVEEIVSENEGAG